MKTISTMTLTALVLTTSALAADREPSAADRAAVMTPINALLKGLEADDGAAVLAVTLPGGAITATRVAPDGRHQRRTLSWADFAASLKPDGTRIEERLGKATIKIDQDIAVVWTPYVVLVDGKISHCGYDHFDVVRVDGQWKLLNVTYSHRTTGCATT